MCRRAGCWNRNSLPSACTAMPSHSWPSIPAPCRDIHGGWSSRRAELALGRATRAAAQGCGKQPGILARWAPWDFCHRLNWSQNSLSLAVLGAGTDARAVESIYCSRFAAQEGRLWLPREGWGPSMGSSPWISAHAVLVVELLAVFKEGEQHVQRAPDTLSREISHKSACAGFAQVNKFCWRINRS